MTDPAPAARKTATIYDIASAAEVSHQSVSRYMRGLDMRASTKAKIEKALETLDYRPNLSARALITGRTHRIGALTHEAHQNGPSQVLQGATAAAREAGYLLDVVTLDMGDVAEIDHALGSLLQYGLDGILAFASTDSTRAVFERTEFGVPVVIAGESDDHDTAHPAATGIDMIVQHLADLGHRSILHIAGPETWAAARNRRHAFETSVAALGLESAGVLHGDWSARSGYDGIRSLDLPPGLSAIVAANDQMALGAMHALHERGIRVPQDVSVTGVDDTPDSAYFIPGLTTLRLDFPRQGRDALVRLLAQIDESAVVAEPPADGPQLVVRGSTAPPRAV
jgi:LacI family transcriptional regulator